MKKTPHPLDDETIPILTEVVAATDGKKAKSQTATPVTADPHHNAPHPLDPVFDAAKVEKLIAHKLQQRLKLLSKELAAEIAAELNTEYSARSQKPPR